LNVELGLKFDIQCSIFEIPYLCFNFPIGVPNHTGWDHTLWTWSG